MILFLLARKTSDDIRGDRDGRHRMTQTLDKGHEIRTVVATRHGGEDRIASRLEGQVQMRADAVGLSGHESDEVIGDARGLDG